MSYTFTSPPGANPIFPPTGESFWCDPYTGGAFTRQECTTTGFVKISERTVYAGDFSSMTSSTNTNFGGKVGFDIDFFNDQTMSMLAFTDNNNLAATIQSGIDFSSWYDEWVMYAISITPTEFDMYCIRCSDGVTLYSYNQVRNSNIPAAFSPAFFMTRLDYERRMTIAENAMWDRALSEAELQAFAQVGFATDNAATDLKYSWEFMTGDTASQFFSTDNPVDVLSVEVTNRGYDEVTVETFTVLSQTANIVVYASGTAPGSAADRYNGVGAVATVTLASPTVGGLDTTTITGLSPDTQYEIYFSHDASTSYLSNNTPDFFTKVLCQLDLVDVSGDALANTAGIEWAWYSEQDPNSFTTPKDSGTGVTLDGQTFRVGVERSAFVQSGFTGALVLYVNDGGTLRTGYYRTALQ